MTEDELEIKDIAMHEEIEKQLRMRKRPASLVGYYNENIVQMGFILYYALVFPLAPAFSIITNFIEI